MHSKELTHNLCIGIQSLAVNKHLWDSRTLVRGLHEWGRVCRTQRRVSVTHDSELEVKPFFLFFFNQIE